MNNSLGSSPPTNLLKNKVGKVPALSVKALHFLIVAKEPKVRADCLELVSGAGSQGIKSENHSTCHLKDRAVSGIG